MNRLCQHLKRRVVTTCPVLNKCGNGLLKLLPAVAVLFLFANINRHRLKDEISLHHAGVTPLAGWPLDSMSIASQRHLRQRSGLGAVAGDTTHNVTAGEAAACWQRLQRRPLLAIVGDSRGRYLYQHLRRSWRLRPHRTANGSECLTLFKYKNRTDWCHYRSSSPLVDVRFFWCRLADAALADVLRSLLQGCESAPASCPQLLVVTTGTHVLYRHQRSYTGRLLAEADGIFQASPLLQSLADRGVRVFWKLSEPENYEQLRNLAVPVNHAHLIYNSLVYDSLALRAPAVRLWSSVLPPAANHISRCSSGGAWNRRPDNSPLWNCFDHLHYGDMVQGQYKSFLLQYLCPAAAAA